MTSSSHTTNEPTAAVVEPQVEPVVAPVEPPAAPEPVDPIAAATAILEAAGYTVRKRTVVERVLMVKAEPLVVAAYFESTGLSRKELADAVGVTVSVIATVGNPNGDRWSATRFAAAQILIDAYVAAKAAAAAPVVTEAPAA